VILKLYNWPLSALNEPLNVAEWYQWERWGEEWSDTVDARGCFTLETGKERALYNAG
jgi:hypothetical protein